MQKRFDIYILNDSLNKRKKLILFFAEDDQIIFESIIIEIKKSNLYFLYYKICFNI